RGDVREAHLVTTCELRRGLDQPPDLRQKVRPVTQVQSGDKADGGHAIQDHLLRRAGVSVREVQLTQRPKALSRKQLAPLSRAVPGSVALVGDEQFSEPRDPLP